MMKKVVQAILVFLLLPGCAAYQQPNDTTHADQPPVILATYAPEVIRPGAVWKVYLRAADPKQEQRGGHKTTRL